MTTDELKSELKSDNYYTAWYAAKELESRGVVLTDADLVGAVLSRESLTPRDSGNWDRCCRASGVC